MKLANHLIEIRKTMRTRYDGGVTEIAEIIRYMDEQLGICIKAAKDSAAVVPEFMPSGRLKQVAAVVLNVVSEATGVEAADMIGQRRPRRIVEARHIAIYVLLQLSTTATLDEVGAVFGNRDHSTIMYARDMMKASIFLPGGGAKREMLEGMVARCNTLLFGDVRATHAAA